MEPWLHRLFFAPLLLFLQFLYHVVANLFLLRIEDFQAVLHRHLPLQVMPLAEKLRVFFFTAKLKWGDIDALEALFERLERLREG